MRFEEIIAAEHPACLLIQPTARHEAPSMDEELKTISSASDKPFTMVLLHVDDWDIDLMPWPDRKISKDEMAGKCSVRTLAFIQEEIIPLYPGLPVIIGGYSLAGLFALWASTRTDVFRAVAAASPSLWIAGWDTYAADNPEMAGDIYLSLGDREEISKNTAIARVGDRVRGQFALLKGRLGEEHCCLKWEQGNHFTDNAGRMGRAFSWCINKIQ